MAGRTPFSELRSRMSPDAQARAQLKSQLLESEMTLADLRRAMQLSQEELAAALKVSQGSVAKMEKRTDMLVGTLRRVLHAMGGELEITARFQDRIVRIDNFSGLTKPASSEYTMQDNPAN